MKILISLVFALCITMPLIAADPTITIEKKETLHDLSLGAISEGVGYITGCKYLASASSSTYKTYYGATIMYDPVLTTIPTDAKLETDIIANLKAAKFYDRAVNYFEQIAVTSQTTEVERPVANPTVDPDDIK